MKFSICIPNYNYAHYLPLTFASIRESTYRNLEVVVSDNASTDNSLEVIKLASQNFQHFSFQVNLVNLGFGPNLDKAAGLATGDYLIMLSSDDLMDSEALGTYHRLTQFRPRAILSSAWDIIDSQGIVTGRTGPNPKIWSKDDIDDELSKEFGCKVYRVKGNILLKRSLLQMATPFNFCTVAYPNDLYTKVGGYEATRLINPDKWFHWKLLTHAEEAIYIDKSLFKYRWHSQNQTAQQLNTGYLKYMMDEYRNTMEVTPTMLESASLSRKEFIKAFIERDIVLHGLGEFSKGRWLKAFRIYHFGWATYPGQMVLNIMTNVLLLALISSPLCAYGISWLRKLSKQ